MNKTYDTLFKISLCMITLICIDIYISQTKLTTKTYEINSEKINNEIRIIQLTDLHSKTFKKNNEDLINKIKEQKPHIITMTGDMINSDDEEYQVLINLVQNLNNIAPVYFSLGNHEYQNKHKNKIIPKIKNIGATILEEEYKDITVNGNKIRIGGAYNYIIPNIKTTTHTFTKEFNNTNNFKILLSHIPDSYVLWNGLQIINPDLILSGHYHGGLIKIPLIGGLYAPEQGLLPKYDSGKYTKNNTNIIISSGLGTSSKIPRINNRPEITLIKID